MAFNAQRQIIGCHAGTIVGHANEGFATSPKGHVDLGCACIKGIFNKLFYHACRALDNFACCNAVYVAFRKTVDSHVGSLDQSRKNYTYPPMPVDFKPSGLPTTVTIK